MNHLDNLLAGRQTGQHLLTYCLGGHRGDKLFDDTKVDIRLEKRCTHLTHRFLNIIFSQLAMAAQLFKSAF